jgi:hypothetical protein
MRSLIALVVLVTVSACGVPGPASPAPTTGASAGTAQTAACDARIDRGVLPDWARAGFSEAEPKVAHVVGTLGEVAAILFGDPLSAPSSGDHANKILWVARRGSATASDLEISAQRMDGSELVGRPVERRVPGGPGPSTIDLPDAGCWRMTLRWADRTDSLDLEYHVPA